MSGHTRLKRALVLRDTLAGSLGLNLERAVAACESVEAEVGARRALDENRWRDALASLTSCDDVVLDALDTAVKDTCSSAGFTPRYAQYLALFLFARWLELRFTSEEALLELANAALAQFRERQERNLPARERETIENFTRDDLQITAFWMATASGKTHVLHACLAMLLPRGHWDRIFIVTPTESLSRQHAARLRALRAPAHARDVFVYPLDGDAAALGHLPASTVVVMDINKLGDKVTGDGQTIPTDRFKDGRNLVFVDEGHKGQKSEASLWKKLQRDLAGIGNPQDKHRGLLVEFSATFGQVAENEKALATYAKSVVFDYAYDRFHADRYGKDFVHFRTDAQAGALATATEATLTAALLAYWWQRRAWLDPGAVAESEQKHLQVADPLWLLLGLHVIGGKNAADKEQTADVVAVLAWLNAVLSDEHKLSTAIDHLKGMGAALHDLLPTGLERLLQRSAAAPLAKDVLETVFGWQRGDTPTLRTLAAASGELGLGLLRGAEVRWFGVVNVGDVSGLKKALEEKQLAVEPDAFTPSLFRRLDQDGTGVNLLIGSRRFAEGWDNYRASSMTLLRLGQKEGSLIVQMFGRVIRLAGVNGDGKRLAPAPDGLQPLQTAYIYGLKSEYLERFVDELKDAGIDEHESVECPFHPALPKPDGLLRTVCAIAPKPEDFRAEALGDAWLRAVGQPVRASLGMNVTSTRLQREVIASASQRVAQDLTTQFKRWLPWLDYAAIHAELVERRHMAARWNLRFDHAAICAALASDKYTIEGMPEALSGTPARDRAQRLAVGIVDQLFGKLYRKREARANRYALSPAKDHLPAKYHKERRRAQT